MCFILLFLIIINKLFDGIININLFCIYIVLIGKSTLASIYNVLREDKTEYFEASDCMEGFTKGIWSLKERIKVEHNACDKINVLDLEGLEDEDIHYFVVVAMALSKAMLLCANYNGSPRFKFDMLKHYNLEFVFINKIIFVFHHQLSMFKYQLINKQKL